MITPNVVCICVCLYSWFSTTRGIASRFSSIDDAHAVAVATRSRRSLIPSSFLSRTSSAMFSTQPRAVDLVRDLGDDDLRLVRGLLLLDHRARAHDDAAAARLLVILDPLAAVDVAAGREVGTLDELAHVAPASASGLSIRCDDRGDRSRAGCAAGCSSPCRPRCPTMPLTSRFGMPDGMTVGSSSRSSKLGAKSTVFLSMSASISIAIGVSSRLGVAVRRRRVAFDRAEVPLAVDERIAQREVLHHAHERVVHALVAVRVVLAEHVADDRRALLVRPPRHEARARSSRTARAGARA